MNITYIIGNGFDLNLGFPTSYSHFYRYYCSLPSKTKSIELLKKDIEQYKDKDWKDLEIGLGKFTSKVSLPEDFKDAYLDLNNQLSKYMSTVDELISSKLRRELIEKIKYDLVFPESELPEELRNAFNGYKNSLVTPVLNNSIIINVISFNYTHTFELFDLDGGEDAIKIKQYTLRYRGITHVHRSVGDRGLWLGVDNIYQISNESFRDSSLIRHLLVKPYDISSSGNGMMNIVKEKINASDLICIFGSSMGETDETWWELIGAHMLNSECRMIHYSVDNGGFETDHMLFYRQNQIRTEVSNKLTNGSDKSTRLNHPNKIYIQINTKLFRDRDYSSVIESNYKSVIAHLISSKDNL